MEHASQVHAAQRVADVKQRLFEHAAAFDGTAAFPHEHFDEIVHAQLHTLTLPELYGGQNYSFEQTAELLIELGSGCGATALCLAMHYYTLAGLGRITGNRMLSQVFDDIRQHGHFMSSFNQPNVMSSFNKAAPLESVKIKIEKVPGGYRINGRKPFVSGSERFKYLPVYGFQEDVRTKFGLTALMVQSDDPGVSLERVWQSSAMRASQSHHVRLADVFVPESRLIGREGYAVEDTNELTFWSRLTIPAVYLGIAKAALEYSVEMLSEKKDLNSQAPLAFMPGPQFALADMRIKFETAWNQLMSFAREADCQRKTGAFGDELFQQSLITKYYVTRAANDIVWQAMQLEGMSSLNRGGLLERLHRDVRAATFHQPTDDLLKEILAKRMLGIVSLRSRWG